MIAIPHVFFGTLRDHYILLFGAAGSVGLAAGLLGSWIGARFGARSAVRAEVREALAEATGKSHLREVNDGLDTLMLEVERISEAQRFVAKLLAERAERPALPDGSVRRAPGSITPH